MDVGASSAGAPSYHHDHVGRRREHFLSAQVEAADEPGSSLKMCPD